MLRCEPVLACRLVVLSACLDACGRMIAARRLAIAGGAGCPRGADVKPTPCMLSQVLCREINQKGAREVTQAEQEHTPHEEPERAWQSPGFAGCEIGRVVRGYDRG